MSTESSLPAQTHPIELSPAEVRKLAAQSSMYEQTLYLDEESPTSRELADERCNDLEQQDAELNLPPRRYRLSYLDKEFIHKNYKYLSSNTMALALRIPVRIVKQYRYANQLRRYATTEPYAGVVIWDR